jgi:hypothetical protein
MAAQAAKSALHVDDVIAAGTQDTERASTSGTELTSGGILALTLGAFHGRKLQPSFRRPKMIAAT